MDIATRLHLGLNRFLVAAHQGLLDISTEITTANQPIHRHGVYFGYNSREISPEEAITASGEVVDDLWQVLIATCPNMSWFVSIGYFVARQIKIDDGGLADLCAGVTSIQHLEFDTDLYEDEAEKLARAIEMVLDAHGLNS